MMREVMLFVAAATVGLGCPAWLSGCDGGMQESPSDVTEGGPEEAEHQAETTASCPEGSQPSGEGCLFPCPEGWERADALGDCIPPCPSGWSRVEDVCAAPCPDGLEAVGPLCRPRESEIGPAACAPQGAFDPSGSEESDQIIHVSQAAGSAGGDGSETSPLQDIDQALAAIDPSAEDVSLLLAAGEYSFPELLEADSTGGADLTFIRILGRCAESTTVELPAGGEAMLLAPSLSFEFARVALKGGIIQIAELKKLGLSDVVFLGDDSVVLALVSWTASGGEIDVNRCEFIGSKYALEDVSDSGVPVSLKITGTRFEGCKKACVVAKGALTVEGCWFVGPGGDGMRIEGSPGTEAPVVVRSSWFDAIDEGAFLSDVSGALLQDNSMRGIIQTPIAAVRATDLTIVAQRLLSNDADAPGDFKNGIAVEESAGASIQDVMVSGMGRNALFFRKAAGVSVASSFLGGCGGAAVVASSDSTSLEVAGSVLERNGKGIDVEGGEVIGIAHNAIRGNKRGGVRVKSVSSARMEDNVVANNGSIGAELASLLPGGGEFVLSGNVLHENVGVGMLLRSTGASPVRVTGNAVLGTRMGVLVNASGGGEIGDGIAVLTGTDAVPSVADLKDNSVSGNIRLGIIGHGTGTLLNVAGNDFGDGGNGYGGLVCKTEEGAPTACETEDQAHSTSGLDLLYQSGAAVKGSDAPQAGAVLVPLGGLVELGGGGEPR